MISVLQSTDFSMVVLKLNHFGIVIVSGIENVRMKLIKRDYAIRNLPLRGRKHVGERLSFLLYGSFSLAKRYIMLTN